MRTPQALDQRSLALHRVIADKRQAPGLLDKPMQTLARWRNVASLNCQPYLRDWQQLIDGGLETCLSVATRDSEHANALRQASLFCAVACGNLVSTACNPLDATEHHVSSRTPDVFGSRRLPSAAELCRHQQIHHCQWLG